MFWWLFFGLCSLLLVSASRVESWSDSSDPGLLASELSLLLSTWLDVPSISDSSNRGSVWFRSENSPGSFRLIMVASLTELSCDVCPVSDGFLRVSFIVMSPSVVSMSTTGSSVCGCGLLLLPLLILVLFVRVYTTVWVGDNGKILPGFPASPRLSKFGPVKFLQNQSRVSC